VETSAYIDATVHCDLEILKGIADKIRNPVTIIGGNLRRLQRHADPKTALFGDYEFLISSTRHCEDMIADITTYMDIFEREARPEECMLETIVDNMLEKLSQRKKLDGVKVEVIISPDALRTGDLTAAPPLLPYIGKRFGCCPPGERAYVRINSVPQEDPPHTVRIDIFNNGEVINLTNISNILTPFYSTKAAGSGLGLSIVKLVTRKNFGGIDFKPIALEGTRVTITLQGTETLSAK
jgi:signal transduction histidine kinase